ncbi:MAG: oligosaccharide repeat unit polymerase [Bacteroidales bacterium]|nr:oligosaccharide repeat unit polymerase [Bacteroidales bacterium]
MNIIKAYCRGCKNSLRRPKMIFLIFAISLLLGLSLALPFFFSFGSAAGHSALSKNIDYTTFSELTTFHAWNLDSILNQSVFTFVVFWLIMIFFVGGIVRTFNKEDYTVSTFFSGAGVNFFRYLLCDILMIVAQIVTAGVLFLIASFLIKLFGTIVSERPLMWAYGIAAFIFLCAVVLLLMISDYAKFYMEMAETHRVFKAIGRATKYVFNNFVKTYFLYALLLVLPILTIVLYKITFEKIATISTFGLILLFLVQQLFIILRVWYRVWTLASQFEMYADDYVQRITFELEPAKVVETVVEETVTTETVISDPESDALSKADKLVVEVNEADENEPVNENETVTVETHTDGNTTVVTETKTVVLNEQGDTFSTITETTTVNDKPETESVEESKTDGVANLEVSESEPEVETEKDAESEPEVETEKDTVSETEVEPAEVSEVKTETENYDDDDEQVEKVVKTVTQVVEDPATETVTTTTTTIETVVVDDGHDSFDAQVAELQKTTDKEVTEPTENEPEAEPDDVDTELLTQFYDNNSEEQKTESVENSEPEKTEESTEESTEETTVVTTTTTETTTTETTTTTTETVEESTGSESNDEEVPGFNPDEQDGNDELEESEEETPKSATIFNMNGETVEEKDQLIENDEADNSDDFSSESAEPDDIDSDDIDMAMGANISLDDEEEDIVSTVTLTSESDTSEPKVIKIYGDNSSKDTFETEVVSESEPDGEPSGEVHQEDAFVKKEVVENEDSDDEHPVG